MSTLIIHAQEIPELSVTYKATDSLGPNHHYLFAINVYVGRAHLNLELKDFVKAKSDVDKLVKYDGKSLAALKLKAHYYFTLKDRPNEIKADDEILSYHPGTKQILLNRGLAKLSIKRNACHDLRRAGELGALEAFSFIKQYCND